MKKILSTILSVIIMLSLIVLPADAAVVSEDNTFSGVPTAADKTYKDGNFQVDLVTGDGVTVTNPEGAVKIVNNEAAANNIKLRIKYPVDKMSGSLKISYTFSLIKAENDTAENIVPTNFGMYTYKKDMETKLSDSVWFLDDQGKWRAGSNNRAKDETDYTINYTLNLSDGAFDMRRGTTKITGGEGTADMTDGFGMVEVTITTPEEAGNGIIFKDISVTENVNKYSDYEFLINGVPAIGSTYGSVKVSTSVASGATGTIENVGDAIVLNGNETTLAKKLRLQFERAITPPLENGKLLYIEILCSADKVLTDISRLFFKITSGSELGGGGLVPQDSFTAINEKHRVATLLDFTNGKYYNFVDGIRKGGWNLTENDISKIHLEYYDQNGAKLTVHDVKYMEIEPYNYDAATNTYKDKTKLLLDKIPYYTIDTWTENGIVFEGILNGDATKAKAENTNGIVFSGTDGISEEGKPGDWARLIVTPNITKDKYPNGYIRITYDFTLKGGEGQSVAIAGREQAGAGDWIINHGNKLNPGDHKIEFLYNPQTDKYTYYVDGVKSRIIENTIEGLPEIMLEYKGSAKTDTLTLKNVSVMNLEDEGDINIGDISVSDDKLSAEITISTDKEFPSVDGKLRFIFASYDESKITAINVQSIALKTGENKINANFESLNGGTRVKAVLWKDFEIMAEAEEK